MPRVHEQSQCKCIKKKKKKKQSQNEYVPCSGHVRATLSKLTTKLWLRSLRTDRIKIYCKRQTVLYGLHEVEND